MNHSSLRGLASRCTIAAPGRFILAFSCLLVLVGWSAPDQAAIARPAVTADIGPVADWIDEMIELLEKVEEELSKSDEEVEAASGGPLSEPARQRIAASLDVVQTRIDRLFSPSHSPSLTPLDAGTVDSNVTPQTLTEYAGETLLAAQQALMEAVSGLADDDVIGTRMKTINSLLPAYRTAAGIQ